MVQRPKSTDKPLPPPVRQRSRRLEKKLRIGEFQEVGFPVSIRLSPALSSKACDEFWDAFLTELIVPRALAFCGHEEGFVMRFGSGSATEADRAAVRDWLQARPGVERAVVGPLEDAWYAPARETHR
ncbi:YggL family protein [Ideonella oryzae]|uniref:YggL family protein n=1 Tax=Ideonella oryzae TaxID=2937441 RepID=A0ABT1BGT5_9BURK|nr:YggL family protein [Ideonella oryzae]MCO5975425.1 YggL family protein [Ideonella oryzae]